jgi:hypothetical protein
MLENFMPRFRLLGIFLTLGIYLCSRTVMALPVSEPIDLLENVPTTYVPGESVEFQDKLPALSNLGAYQVDLLVESATALAGVDFSFDLPSINIADSDYVFMSSDFFAAATNLEGANRQRLTLTDFELAGIDVVPNVNDLIGTIVLRTFKSLNAVLEIKVDAQSLILDTPQVVPTSVLEFQFIQNGVLASGPIKLRPVPEPTTVCLLIVLALAEICSPFRSSINHHKSKIH